MSKHHNSNKHKKIHMICQFHRLYNNTTSLSSFSLSHKKTHPCLELWAYGGSGAAMSSSATKARSCRPRQLWCRSWADQKVCQQKWSTHQKCRKKQRRQAKFIPFLVFSSRDGGRRRRPSRNFPGIWIISGKEEHGTWLQIGLLCIINETFFFVNALLVLESLINLCMRNTCILS